jgi:hypothetical protein
MVDHLMGEEPGRGRRSHGGHRSDQWKLRGRSGSSTSQSMTTTLNVYKKQITLQGLLAGMQAFQKSLGK